MSGNIARRILSYQGYQPNAKPPDVLLVVFTRAYEELEIQSHLFASQKLPRYGGFEIFEIPNGYTISDFIVDYLCFVQDVFGSHVTRIVRDYRTPLCDYITPTSSSLPTSNIKMHEREEMSETIYYGGVPYKVPKEPLLPEIAANERMMFLEKYRFVPGRPQTS